MPFEAADRHSKDTLVWLMLCALTVVFFGLASVRLIESLGGYRVSDNYKTDAYGVELASSGVTSNAYRFAGEQFDFDLGQHFLRSRYFDKTKGKFLTFDSYEGTLTIPESLHKYLYVENRPADLTDPTGHGVTLSELGFELNLNSIVSVLRSPVFQAAAGLIAFAATSVALSNASGDILDSSDPSSLGSVTSTIAFSNLVQEHASAADDILSARKVMIGWIAKARLRHNDPNLNLVIPLPSLNPLPEVETPRIYEKVRDGLYTMTGGPGGRILGAFLTRTIPTDGMKVSSKIDIGQAHYHAMDYYPAVPFTVHLHPGSNYRTHLMLYPEKRFIIFGAGGVNRNLEEGDLE